VLKEEVALENILTQKPEFKKWVTLLTAFSLLVFILYFLFFTDLREVAEVIEGVNVSIYDFFFVNV
jgi:hypothetical protein